VQIEKARKKQLMKLLMNFALKLNVKLTFSSNFIVETGGRYFLLNKNLKAIAPRSFFYVGRYLGEVKNGKFFPSFNLLAILASRQANKVVVNKKASWLFICGRDIFSEGIVSVQGSRRKGALTLVLNEFEECLGLGRIISDFGAMDTKVVVENIADVGDFLRRER
jgi:ribosome biogenesis protein Nip4